MSRTALGCHAQSAQAYPRNVLGVLAGINAKRCHKLRSAVCLLPAPHTLESPQQSLSTQDTHSHGAMRRRRRRRGGHSHEAMRHRRRRRRRRRCRRRQQKHPLLTETEIAQQARTSSSSCMSLMRSMNSCSRSCGAGGLPTARTCGDSTRRYPRAIGGAGEYVVCSLTSSCIAVRTNHTDGTADEHHPRHATRHRITLQRCHLNVYKTATMQPPQRKARSVRT